MLGSGYRWISHQHPVTWFSLTDKAFSTDITLSFIRRGTFFNIRSRCNDIFVALTPQETKKSHDFRPKKWSWYISWTELRCLSDTIVICLGIVTWFGNCTNVWLITNAKCCCFFLCVSVCINFVFIFHQEQIYA